MGRHHAHCLRITILLWLGIVFRDDIPDLVHDVLLDVLVTALVGLATKARVTRTGRASAEA